MAVPCEGVLLVCLWALFGCRTWALGGIGFLLIGSAIATRIE